MNVLVIDVGGTHVKLRVPGKTAKRKFDSGSEMTPDELVAQVLKTVGDWKYDAVSIGFPGVVADGKIKIDPKNLKRGWVGFDFEKRFKKPVRIINDAAMQALGSYKGGRMLFLGLGTGLGSAMISDGVLIPLELSNLRFSKRRNVEQMLGKAGLKRLRFEAWERTLHEVVKELRAVFVTDYIVIGGGNVKLLKRLPPGAVRGENNNAFQGGVRLWEIPEKPKKREWRVV